jgi:hypothetical protein
VKKKRTEITIEIDELMLIKSRRGGPVQSWCPACAEEVEMITPNEAARIAGVSVRAINRWIEAQMIHFAETADGQLFVCVNSLGGSRA